MELNLIIDILTEVDTFQKSQSNTQTSLEDFRLYLNEKAYENETPRNLTGKFDLEVFDLENEIAKQVIMLGRYSKHLMKDITVASKIMCGKLDDYEKENLLDSLKKLNTFHQTLYTNLRNESPSILLKLINNEA